jgi:hypothetical protein
MNTSYNNYIQDETDFETKSIYCDDCDRVFTASQLTNDLCDDCHLREIKEKQANLKQKLRNLKDSRDRNIIETQIQTLSLRIAQLNKQLS